MLFWQILPKSTPQITSIYRYVKLKRTRVIKYSNCIISSQTSKTNKQANSIHVMTRDFTFMIIPPAKHKLEPNKLQTNPNWETSYRMPDHYLSKLSKSSIARKVWENVVGQKLWRNYSKLSLWLGQKEDRREEEMNLIKLWNWVRTYQSFSSFWQMYIKN